jgi:hypothetical protein
MDDISIEKHGKRIKLRGEKKGLSGQKGLNGGENNVKLEAQSPWIIQCMEVTRLDNTMYGGDKA